MSTFLIIIIYNINIINYNNIADYDAFGLSINELPLPLNFEPSTIEHSDSRGTLRLSLKQNERIGRE